MKRVTGLELDKDILTLSYYDDAEPTIDTYTISINWKTIPEIKKVILAVTVVLGTYLLTDNKNLTNVQQEDLEDLLHRLLQEPTQE